MTAGHYLFGFTGRINRAKAWLFVLIQILVFVVLAILFASFVGMAAFSNPGASQNAAANMGGAALVISLLCGLIGIAMFIASLAVLTKRLHDRNKSGWWLLLFYVLPFILNIVALSINMAGMMHQPPQTNPVGSILSLAALALGIWGFVELYCLRGTVGDNRYGPDPLAGR